MLPFYAARRASVLGLRRFLASGTPLGSTVGIRGLPDGTLDVELVLPVPGKGSTLFVTHPQEPLRALVDYIRDEDRSAVKSVSFERKDGTKLDLASSVVADVVREDILIRLGDKQITLDRQPAQQYASDQRARLDALQGEFKKLSTDIETVRRSAERRGALFRWAVAAGLIGQLQATIYLTYELGWDLMEPTTYCVGLGVSVISMGIFIITRKDYEYGVHFEKVAQWLENRALKRSNLDISKLVDLDKEIQLVRSNIDLVSLPSTDRS